MSKCKYPNCDCIEQAEKENGGNPVKNYPCLHGLGKDDLTELRSDLKITDTPSKGEEDVNKEAQSRYPLITKEKLAEIMNIQVGDVYERELRNANEPIKEQIAAFIDGAEWQAKQTPPTKEVKELSQITDEDALKVANILSCGRSHIHNHTIERSEPMLRVWTGGYSVADIWYSGKIHWRDTPMQLESTSTEHLEAYDYLRSKGYRIDSPYYTQQGAKGDAIDMEEGFRNAHTYANAMEADCATVDDYDRWYECVMKFMKKKYQLLPLPQPPNE